MIPLLTNRKYQSCHRKESKIRSYNNNNKRNAQQQKDNTKNQQLKSKRNRMTQSISKIK